MSVVTSVIVKTFVQENEDSTAIDKINAYLINKNKGKLNQIDEHCGGTKYIECDLWIGGFNKLDHEEFLQTCHAQRWIFPEDVQIYIMGEYEDLLTEHRIENAST